MAKIVFVLKDSFVLCVDPIDEDPKSCRGSLLEINPCPAQIVPATGSESATDGRSVFGPNLDLALP